MVAKGPEAVDFFDEDDDPEQPRRRGGSRATGGSVSSSAGRGGVSREQIRIRQAVLAVGAILLLILIVLAFRGCLDARKDRSFENYVSDLSSITTETDQLSDGFFARLIGDSEVEGVTFQTEVDGDKGTAQGLLDRAAGLDAPDDLGAAQEQIELSYELRHDALEGIAAQVGAAQSENSAATDASQVIYTQMKVLSASDILFARAKDQIEQALEDEEVVVEEGVPSSQFLPDKPDYLDPDVVDRAVGVIAGAGGTSGGSACPGNDPGDEETHGLGITSALLLPSETALEDGATATASGDGEIQIDVQNQGTAPEGDITVDVSSDGAISGSQQIDEIAAGETQSVSVALEPAPKAGSTVELNVEVATVCGEQLATNNKATYTVTF